METLTVLQDVMREYFLPAVPERFNNKLTLYAEMEKTAKGIDGGKSVVIPLHIALNERGVGNRTENETLPTAGANEYDQASASIKYIYGVLSLTGQAMKMTKGKLTLIDELKRSMNGLMSALEWEVERQLWGNGDGWICEVDDSPAVGSGGSANTFFWKSESDIGNGNFFKRGMYIDSYAQNGTKHGDSVQVTDVNYTTKMVTVGAIGTIAAGDYVCREDCVTWSGSAFVSRDITGLKQIVGVGAFEGITPTATANSFWKSIIHDPSNTTNRDLTDLLLMALLDDIYSASDELPTAIYGSLGLRRAYKKMMDDLNIPTESMPTKAGFQKGYKYVFDGNEIPFIGTRHAWPNRLLVVNTDYLWLAEAAKLDWDDLGGGILKPRETTDSLWGRLSWFVNLVTDHRQAHGSLGYLTEY